MQETLILAIDTSCDDTSASVVRGGRRILTDVVSGQGRIHAVYGGIVPELASRSHVEMITPVVREALEGAGVPVAELSAVAVCHGPGLIGSLIVGCAFAKSFSYACGLPLIGVNHLEGHIWSANLLEEGPPPLPFISLVVSGGHTALYRVDGPCEIFELGKTRDDAAGEAYDKAARLLGLGFPGGPAIDGLAGAGDPKRVKFPRAYMPDSLDFSFSGLKTAVANYVRSNASGHGAGMVVEDVCAGFQSAVVDVLVEKIKRAMAREGVSTVALGGGVAANGGLRHALAALGEATGVNVIIPPKKLCTDNAAMIGAAAHVLLMRAETDGQNVNKNQNLDLNPKAYLPVSYNRSGL
ncbi:MAG: tRNA (adenosine(37)-N6)-threonylcarbamoyltransferase complex transferase subunit TsaD [Nitrospirae bacterium]|nr:tRNA (adenosine(37)-N6)-threonylcarbamoyltransferase complex transferase subunit TsaD [Nitrospirota bacterium]